MALEIKPLQKLLQRPVMTPQLRQAIKILQLARADLETLVDEEVAENPLIEIAGEDGEETPAAGQEQEQPVPEPQELDWERYLASYEERPAGDAAFTNRGDDERQPSLENTLSRGPSLADHLLWQVGTAKLSPGEEDVAVLLIGNVDEDGYLQTSLDDVAQQTGAEPEVVQRVLRIIQECDPPGVAARDLRECLLLQLKSRGLEDSLAARIVSDHLIDVEHKRFDKLALLAKGLGASDPAVQQQEVAQAVGIIASLEPKPGRNFGPNEVQYVIPDVHVQRIGDEYVVTLSDEGLPRLRVSRYYRQMLGQKGETGEYVKEKLRAAVWLIKSIEQRQQTLRRVAESLVKFQRDFLDTGVSRMRPLVLRDVAQDIGMHESTVSRVVANKYMATPHGIYPLKYFFTNSLKGGQGQDVAAESVKDRIRQFISHECPTAPLSDEDLARTLAKNSVIIARRTVAKYRESMGILPSAKRRRPAGSERKVVK